METDGWTEETYEAFWNAVGERIDALPDDAFDFLGESDESV